MRVEDIRLARIVFLILTGFMGYSHANADGEKSYQVEVGGGSAIRTESNGDPAGPEASALSQGALNLGLKVSHDLRGFEITGKGRLSKVGEKKILDPKHSNSALEGDYLSSLAPIARNGYTGELIFIVKSKKGPFAAKFTPISKDLFLTQSGVGVGVGTGSEKSPEKKSLLFTVDYARLGYTNTSAQGALLPDVNGNALILSLGGQSGTFLKNIFQISGKLRMGAIRWDADKKKYEADINMYGGSPRIFVGSEKEAVVGKGEFRELDREAGTGLLLEASLALTAHFPELLDMLSPYIKVQLDFGAVNSLSQLKNFNPLKPENSFEHQDIHTNGQVGVGVSAGADF